MPTDALAVAATAFTASHIAFTAVVTGLLALAAAAWRLPRGEWPDIAAVGVLAVCSVFLWRSSANMPQLNSDGLPAFSANDWLAPGLDEALRGSPQLRNGGGLPADGTWVSGSPHSGP